MQSIAPLDSNVIGNGNVYRFTLTYFPEDQWSSQAFFPDITINCNDSTKPWYGKKILYLDIVDFALDCSFDTTYTDALSLAVIGGINLRAIPGPAQPNVPMPLFNYNNVAEAVSTADNYSISSCHATGNVTFVGANRVLSTKKQSWLVDGGLASSLTVVALPFSESVAIPIDFNGIYIILDVKFV